MSSALREQIVAEALSWLETPYHPHARIKGEGVDCAQILLAIYADALQLAPALNVGEYSMQWHWHNSEEAYLEWLAKAGAHRVEQPQLGDIAMWKFGRTFSHSGICVADGEFVHALVGAGKVVHTRITEAPLEGREVQYWSIVK